MRTKNPRVAEVGASKIGWTAFSPLRWGVLLFAIAAAVATSAAEAAPGNGEGVPAPGAAEENGMPTSPAATEATTTETTDQKPAPVKKSSNSAKVLEITTIEGQLLFPKVLFISAEDPARYSQLLHRNYLDSALDLGRDVPRPKTIVIPNVLHPAEDVSASAAASAPNATETSTPNPPEVKP